MTLEEFIRLQRNNLSKFEEAQIRGISKFNWPTNQYLIDWEEHYKKWENIRKDTLSTHSFIEEETTK